MLATLLQVGRGEGGGRLVWEGGAGHCALVLAAGRAGWAGRGGAGRLSAWGGIRAESRGRGVKGERVVQNEEGRYGRTGGAEQGGGVWQDWGCRTRRGGMAGLGVRWRCCPAAWLAEVGLLVMVLAAGSSRGELVSHGPSRSRQ